jgi:hypothetical protein
VLLQFKSQGPFKFFKERPAVKQGSDTAPIDWHYFLPYKVVKAVFSLVLFFLVLLLLFVAI